MSTSVRRAIWLILLPFIVVAVLGLLAVWGIRSFLAGPTPAQNDAPTELARVSIPHQASALAWSADGAFLAAGAWGWGPADTEPGPSEIYLVDVAKGSVPATVKANGVIQALAFSPDGKHLAVGTTQSTWHPASVPPAAALPELVVFDIPALTAKFTAKSTQGNGFSDLAWAADGKTLYAIDAPEAMKEKKAPVRRWDVLGFTEQPAITAPQIYQYEALAVSPDGGTLAVADVGQGADGKTHLIRLFDLPKGVERASSGATPTGNFPPRLGFSPDSKAVGVLDTGKMSWYDVVTGKPATAAGPRIAIQPASLSRLGGARDVVSTDGRWRAEGYTRNRDFGDIGGDFDGKDKEYGAFVRLTEGGTAKARTWRLGKGDTPVLAFSADGTKLACSVSQPSGESIVIWAVPK